jgi:hypothetical protein
MASTDPAALDYFAAKHVLMPTSRLLGYDDVDLSTMDPDYTGDTFNYYLNRTTNVLVAGGFNVTIDENRMNVFVKQARAPTDLNDDGKVDLADLAILAQAYGSRPGDPRWNTFADINGDGQIGLLDLVTLAQHYGQ